jgi:2-oxoglutarate dehydrogenase E2 component (dihydrolipoamide succinyltransferase)
MILSLSYDHRVIDGALAGKFLNRIKDILENYSSDIILS